MAGTVLNNLEQILPLFLIILREKSDSGLLVVVQSFLMNRAVNPLVAGSNPASGVLGVRQLQRKL